MGPQDALTEVPGLLLFRCRIRATGGARMAQLETCKHLASRLARGEVPSTGLIGPAVVCYFVRRLPEGVVR